MSFSLLRDIYGFNLLLQASENSQTQLQLKFEFLLTGLCTSRVQTSHNVEKEVLTENWSKSEIHYNDQNIE